MQLEEILSEICNAAFRFSVMYQIDFDLRITQFLRDMQRKGIKCQYKNNTLFVKPSDEGAILVFGHIYGFGDIIEHTWNELNKYLPVEKHD